jgi:hypothetical protein
MSLLIIAGLMMAQAPSASQPPGAKRAKPQKVCEMVEVTGSRSKKRVCRDESGRLDLGPGVSDNVDTRGTLTQQPVGHTGGPGS